MKKRSLRNRSLIRTGLHTIAASLLLVVVAWAANFTINGNLIVNGDTTTNKLTASSDLKTTGNLDVTGRINTANVFASGNLSANGNVFVSNGAVSAKQLTTSGLLSGKPVTITGNTVTSDNVLVNEDLTVAKSTTLMKSYKQYFISLTDGNPKVNGTPMGNWDFCSLTTMTVAGENDDKEDSATCNVYANSFSSTIGRPTWQLAIAAGSTKINYVECRAICMSFSSAPTGN